MCINTSFCGGTSRKEHEANSCMFTKDRLRISCENKRPPDVSLILGRDLQTRTRWRLIPARKQHNSSLLSFLFQHKPSKLLPNYYCIQLATRTVVFLWILSDHLKLEDWYPQSPTGVSSLKGWEGYSQHGIPLLLLQESMYCLPCPLLPYRQLSAPLCL